MSSSGVGASHKTGWSGLVGKLLQQRGKWAGLVDPVPVRLGDRFFDLFGGVADLDLVLKHFAARGHCAAFDLVMALPEARSD